MSSGVLNDPTGLCQVLCLRQRVLNLALEGSCIAELPANRLAHMPGRCGSSRAQRHSNKGVVSRRDMPALLNGRSLNSARVPDEDVINALPCAVHLVTTRAFMGNMSNCTCHSLLNHPFHDNLSSLGSQP